MEGLLKGTFGLGCKSGWSWLALGLAGFVLVRSQAASNAPEGTSASNGSPQRLSLAEVQRTAFEKNWDLLAAKSGVDFAVAQRIVAGEYPNPNLALSAAKIGTHDNATLAGNSLWHRSYDTIAAISQLVEIGGKRRDRRTSTQAGIAGATARFFDAKRSLEQGVTKAYVAALLAEENVRILSASAESLRHQANIAAARFNAGDISDSDLKQIENNADMFELQAKSAAATAVQARLTVQVLMGTPEPKGDWVPTDALDKLALAVPPAVEGMAGSGRPDVLAAEADLRRSESDLKLQKAMRIPDPTISLLYEHSPNQPSPPPASDTVGLGVSFPLPLWNRNRGAIKSAEASRDQAAVALAKVRAQVVSDLVSAEAAYREASERLQKYQDQIRPKAAKVRAAVAFAYETGGASLVDLLTAERDDNNVRLATAQAMSDTASANADLTAARAVLSRTELTSRK